jgi:hypothetical protein
MKTEIPNAQQSQQVLQLADLLARLVLVKPGTPVDLKDKPIFTDFLVQNRVAIIGIAVILPIDGGKGAQMEKKTPVFRFLPLIRRPLTLSNGNHYRKARFGGRPRMQFAIMPETKISPTLCEDMRLHCNVLLGWLIQKPCHHWSNLSRADIFTRASSPGFVCFGFGPVSWPMI